MMFRPCVETKLNKNKFTNVRYRRLLSMDMFALCIFFIDTLEWYGTELELVDSKVR